MAWDKTCGRIGNDFGYSVVQTSDGGYAICGVTTELGGGYTQIYLVKTAAENGLAWVSKADTIVLYRGETDTYWNYVRVRIWRID